MVEITEHISQTDEKGKYFCRCMNIQTKGAQWLCSDCPLFKEFFKGDNKNGVVCRYGEDSEEFPLYWNEHIKEIGIIGKLPQNAIKFAAVAHKGATRKGNGLPYIIHPMETMSIVAGMTDDAEVMAAAALHDVIEDTKYTGRDIEEGFGQRVARLVGMESEDKKRHRPAGDTWRERKEENLIRERLAPIEAKMIMLSDKLSNIRATYRDFTEERGNIWEKFNMKDPAEQEWYYRSVAKVVEELSDTKAYDEYVSLVNKIFE